MPRKVLTDEQLLDVIAERPDSFLDKLWQYPGLGYRLQQAKSRAVPPRPRAEAPPTERPELTLGGVLEGLRPYAEAKVKAERDRGFANLELIQEIIRLKATRSWPRVAEHIHRNHPEWCGAEGRRRLEPKDRTKLTQRLQQMYQRYKEATS